MSFRTLAAPITSYNASQVHQGSYAPTVVWTKQGERIEIPQSSPNNHNINASPPLKDIIRKKLYRLTASESNSEVRQEAERFYNYLEKADTRSKAKRQLVLNRLKTLSEMDNCETCPSLMQDNIQTIQNTWGKNSRLSEGKIDTRLALQKNIERIISQTDDHQIKSTGNAILDTVQNLDLRRNKDRNLLFNMTSQIQNDAHCNIINPVFNPAAVQPTRNYLFVKSSANEYYDLICANPTGLKNKIKCFCRSFFQ